MTRKLWLLWMMFLTLGFSARAEAPAILTLEESYRLALRRSESIALSEEEVRRAEIRYDQVRSGTRPEAGLRASELIQDTSGSSASRTRAESRAYLQQTLFTGFREMAVLRAVKLQTAAQSSRLERAKQLLYGDVARAFYNVLDRERELVLLETQKRLLEERAAELEKRFRIGRSRKSELLSTRLRMTALEARIEETRGLRGVSLELLSFLTGIRAAGLTDAAPVPEVRPVEDYLAKVAVRPDLAAARGELEASRYVLDSARRGRWPVVDFESNYYFQRGGSNKNVDWDMLFSADWPFYTGGQYTSSVRAGESDVRSADLTLARSLRGAELEVRALHQELTSAVAREAKLRESVSVAEENYALQLGEYRLGLVNNLEVMSALDQLTQARLDHQSAMVDSLLNAARMRSIIGEIP